MIPSTPRTATLPQGATGPAQAAPMLPYSLFFVIYTGAAIWFYLNVVAPYLASSDLYAPRILADAITYESICVAEADFFDRTTLRDIGPCVGLRLFGYDSGLLSIFNGVMIVVSIVWLARTYERPWRPFLALVLINPITFLSVFGPNKEVFGLVALTTLAIFIRSRSVLALGICLVTALFTRLPAFILIGAYCAMLVTVLPRSGQLSSTTRRRYYLVIAAIAVGISLVAAVFGEELQYNLLGDFSRAEDVSQSTGISLSLDYLSSFGAYMALYVMRMAFNLYSGMVGVIGLWRGESANYYTVGVAGSSIVFALLSVVAVVAKRPDDMAGSATAWNIILFVAFFTLVICLSPVIQHRYFFPLYVLLLLFVVKRDRRLVREVDDGRNVPHQPSAPVIGVGL